MKKKEEGVEDANQTKEQIKDEKVLFSQKFQGRGRGRGGRDSGRSGRGSNFERGQSSQQNWRGRGRGQRGGRSNHSNFECYKCGKYGHYAKDCNSFKCYNCYKVGHLAKDYRIEKKVEETTNLTLEAEANEGFLLMAQNEINSNDNVWYLDLGASNHMCGHKHLFKEMRKIEDGNVSFGDASKVKVGGKGTIRYLQKDGLIGSIEDVYYVPNLKTNILSLGQLTEKGYSILMKERILHLKDELGHLIARVEMERNRMYKLNLINVREKCLQVNVEDKVSLWHLRFGHLHHAGLKSEEAKVVCVTGASGYIASWIVKFLLQRGYTVKATVRDPSNPNKVNHLLKLDGAKERLQLFKADLLEDGSFDSAIQGCHGVFHTASPVQFGVDDPQVKSPSFHRVNNNKNNIMFSWFQKEIIDPAVKGTMNVLKSCAKSPSVKRFVFTSSIVTALYSGKPRNPEAVVDETWFSNPDFLRNKKMWYQFAKTLAEEVATKFLTENNIDCIVMNPAMTIGPLLQPEINESSTLILDLINGSETFTNAAVAWINVKDVAIAHILAYEDSSASGRYCLSERVIHFSELTKILGHMYPTLQIPNKCADDKPLKQIFQVSKEKAKKLGVEFIPLEVSLKEIVESLKEKRFAKL
ncbi:hypothetical protein KIW84_073876 [Lathyrus oleraceus]|uniref:CCHC-type domain-containing protein n=1 Tax=Pisum sativum TaxID=3888 RepID=A0A9D4VS70_PEA|nr:hypothetical protein KIW84_073876 [Pisum sativum]